MSHATLQTTIETIFTDAWKLRANSRWVADNGTMLEWVVDIDPGPPIVDNSGWRPVDPTVQDLDPYVTLEIHDGKSKTITIGGNVKLRRTIGMVFVEVAVPRQSGTIVARQMADDVKAIFRSVALGAIEFFEASVTRVGESYYAKNGSAITESSQKWTCTVGIPFRYDVSL